MSQGYSKHWILNSLAGMRFVNQTTGQDAYDYMQIRFAHQEGLAEQEQEQHQERLARLKQRDELLQRLRNRTKVST